jgi:hypothetical protein
LGTGENYIRFRSNESESLSFVQLVKNFTYVRFEIESEENVEKMDVFS